MTRLELALSQLELARSYSLHLVQDIPEKDWYWMPEQGVTNIAWQVGHLASAQYFLSLARIRGTRPEDRELFPVDDFSELFGRTSTPQGDPEKYPTPAQLLGTLERITAQAGKELPGLTEEQLDQLSEWPKPHPIVTTKLSALLWCASHEFVHAGQIGLLRRLLGSTPKW